MICTTHERSFDARESPDGYRIQPGFVRQEFALNDCAEVTESDFGSVSVIDQVGPSGTRASELDDRALIKFISPLTAMSRIASAQAQTVRLHYNGSFDVDRLRRFLAQIDPRSIDYVAVDLMRQRTVISIEINDNHFSVTFAFDNDRLTDIEVVDTVLIF